MGPYTYNVVRKLRSPEWNQTTQIIDYSEEYYYDMLEEDSLTIGEDNYGTSSIWDANITSFNMGAWSTWH